MVSRDLSFTGLTPAEEALARSLLTATTLQPTRGALRGFYLRHRPAILGTLSVAVFLAIWQLLASTGLVPTILASSPAAVWAVGIQLAEDPETWGQLAVTVLEFGVGFVAAAILGIVLGLLMGRYRWFLEIMNPFVSALYAAPRIALMPLVVLWFGIGNEARIILVFSIAVLPVIVNTLAGVRSVDVMFVRVARMFGAGDLDLFRTVTLPYAVPYVLAGLRIATGQGMIAVIAAEFLIGSQGLGYLLNFYGASFLTAKLMFIVLVTAALGVVVVELLSLLERRFQSWRPAPQE